MRSKAQNIVVEEDVRSADDFCNALRVDHAPELRHVPFHPEDSVAGTDL